MIFVQKPAKADESYLRYGEEVFVGLWAKMALYGRGNYVEVSSYINARYCSCLCNSLTERNVFFTKEANVRSIFVSTKTEPKKRQATPNTIAPSTSSCPRRKNDPEGIGPA